MILKIQDRGWGDKTESVKTSLHKGEDLSSDTQHTGKKAGCGSAACVPSTGEAEVGKLLVLARQLLGPVGALQGDPALQRKVQSD